MKNTTGILVAGCLCVLVVLPTHAETLIVTNRADSGPGSLRQAIEDAQPGDEIQFMPWLDRRSINVTGGELVIDKDLTITGRGPDRTIVRAWDRSRVFYIADVTVAFSGMKITDGRHEVPQGDWGKGGGIYNRGTLTLVDTHVTWNCAGIGSGGIGYGGGIYNHGTLTLVDSRVAGNWAGPDRGGGGHGGGIYNRGTLTVDQSEISFNRTSRGPWSYGGGIYNRGTASIDHSSISNNNAALGGGGIKNSDSLTVRNSTISGNGVTYGHGGGMSGRRITIVDSTIYGNYADSHAGGIFAGTSVTVRNSTISGNPGGDIGSAGLDDTELIHSIVGSCSGVVGRIVSLGYNLDTSGTCNLTHRTDLPDTDPLLAPLADNGGPTLTCALQAGSPAIDSGGRHCEPRDQRGVPRPHDGDGRGGARCDIGAFEYMPVPLQVIPRIHDLVLELMGGDHGVVSPLQQAIQILEDGDPSNDGQAVDSLLAFIAEVEERRDLTLTDADADELIAEAQRIIAVLNFDGEAGRGR